ncbi:hypothetical protein FTV88_1309 [Heliorestis convoluta]|uniref:Uncharacterized protein n=1 Tax=Heliorestis convoluta TaxID=356322 RepID=A0A5Q2N1J1_9FIRM|nr:hypothetical protein FTV88_1309 [Heliorestis convoluta]
MSNYEKGLPISAMEVGRPFLLLRKSHNGWQSFVVGSGVMNSFRTDSSHAMSGSIAADG